MSLALESSESIVPAKGFLSKFFSAAGTMPKQTAALALSGRDIGYSFAKSTASTLYAIVHVGNHARALHDRYTASIGSFDRYFERTAPRMLDAAVSAGGVSSFPLPFYKANSVDIDRAEGYKSFVEAAREKGVYVCLGNGGAGSHVSLIIDARPDMKPIAKPAP